MMNMTASLMPLRGRVRPRREAEDIFGEPYFCGESLFMKRLYGQIRQAAATDRPVLILGETGTGKELAARTIHLRSARRAGPYVPVNLGAVAGEIVGSELFGCGQGAPGDHAGPSRSRVEQAEGGTLFLDEVALIDENTQRSLLRLIERREFRPVGSDGTFVRADVRVIAASNQDPDESVERGRVRDDLYHRPGVFRISLSPLRERKEDISLLTESFLDYFSRRFHREVTQASSACMRILEAYEWPGNVRQLKNVVRRAVLVCKGRTLLPEHLPSRFLKGSVPWGRLQRISEVTKALDRMEREMIIRTLEVSRNDPPRAAELLGISCRDFCSKLYKYNLYDLR